MSVTAHLVGPALKGSQRKLDLFESVTVGGLLILAAGSAIYLGGSVLQLELAFMTEQEATPLNYPSEADLCAMSREHEERLSLKGESK